MPFFTLQRFITTTITSAGSCAHHTISGAGSLYFPGCHSFPFSAACKTPSSLADFSSDFHDTALPPFCRHIRSPDILKLKKGGPTLSVDSPNIDQHKKSALLCSKALFLVHHRGLSRALKTPHWGVFARRTGGGPELFSSPDGAPDRTFFERLQ